MIAVVFVTPWTIVVVVTVVVFVIPWTIVVIPMIVVVVIAVTPWIAAVTALVAADYQWMTDC